MKIILIFFGLINLISATEVKKDKPSPIEKTCQETEASWMKCTGHLPQGVAGESATVSAKSAKKNECYVWVGKAKYSCENGKWVIEKMGQFCNWDCICCY